ncbi:MAG: hypothetical protein H0T51_27015, partial [Pirellulales bacterium]|nr:hypothetical protein [Pirellulales bacterium]
VNAQDLATWKAQFSGEKFPGRIVDGADFLIWQRQLGAVAASTAAGQMAAAPAVEVAAVSAPAALATDPAAAGLASTAPSESPRSVPRDRSRAEVTPFAAVPRTPLRADAVDHAFGEASADFRSFAVARDKSTPLAVETEFREATDAPVGNRSGHRLAGGVTSPPRPPSHRP